MPHLRRAITSQGGDHHCLGPRYGKINAQIVVADFNADPEHYKIQNLVANIERRTSSVATSLMEIRLKHFG